MAQALGSLLSLGDTWLGFQFLAFNLPQLWLWGHLETNQQIEDLYFCLSFFSFSLFQIKMKVKNIYIFIVYKHRKTPKVVLPVNFVTRRMVRKRKMSLLNFLSFENNDNCTCSSNIMEIVPYLIYPISPISSIFETCTRTLALVQSTTVAHISSVVCAFI